MRLVECWLRDPVRDDSNTPLTRLHETHGYALTYEAGMVTVAHKGMAAGRLVPASNVASMTPAPAEKKK